MKRKYNTEQTDSVDFFVGTEIEHSPAYGKKTLFVVGLQNVTEIHSRAVAYECDHIYFGANQSFPKLASDDADQWKAWEDMIYTMLKSERKPGKPYWCTLDFDVSCVEGLAEGGLCEHRRFIPMVSVKIPYVQLLNFNFNGTLKIDDVSFDRSNPGVWCHRLQDLLDHKKFTGWDEYVKDEIIK